MLFGTKNVLLLFTTTSMLVLLSVMPAMVEGQQQLLSQENKHGNLRRALQSTPTDAPSTSSAPSSAPSAAPLDPVLLLKAGKFAILTKTGFGLIEDPSSGEFSTSSLVIDGELYAADHSDPTPTVLTTSVLDMQEAYTNAAGRTDPDFTELGAGNLDGLTLSQGLYKWGTGVLITNSLVFDGPADAVWILQVAGDVTIGNGAQMTLMGGAQSKNIFWQVAGQTLFGTTSQSRGVFLCQTEIVFQTGSRLIGAALAQTAVTLDAATIVKESVCDTTVGCQL